MNPMSAIPTFEFSQDDRLPKHEPSRRLQNLRQTLRHKRLFHPTWQDDEMAHPPTLPHGAPRVAEQPRDPTPPKT